MTLSVEYSNFQISSSYEIPKSLRQLLYKAWQNRYEEFYEEEADGTISLEETLLEILDALGDRDDSLCHVRYVCMAIILALAVEPTVKAYLPNEQKTEKIWKSIVNWSKNRELPTEETINQLFPQKSLGSQSIDEALDVFKNLLQALNPANAKEALLEILDDCLEGYAIFPGSQGRRDLFNWWLLEVVPAAWCLQFPENVYTIKGIQSLDRNFLQDDLPDIFNNYKNQLSRLLLFNKLNINLDEVPFEQLVHYTAVEYYLTIEDELPADATNLEKVNKFLESFNHLCQAEAWEKASTIFRTRLETPTNDELHRQLRLWGYYKEQINISLRLFRKLDLSIDVICANSLGTAYGFVGQYQEAINYHQQALEIAIVIGSRDVLAVYVGCLGEDYVSLGQYQEA
ncbi:MAG: tetratricopeptide repeat protein, partial [Cyanobacteria bacterium P01_A01_bin.84]